MASNADVLRQVVDLLMSRPTVRSRARRGGGDIGLSFRPNAPKMVTILVAIGLTVVGIAVNLHPIQPVLDLLANANLELTRTQGWYCLLASPVLLIAGSLFRGL
jgi:hypothetical protein